MLKHNTEIVAKHLVCCQALDEVGFGKGQSTGGLLLTMLLCLVMSPALHSIPASTFTDKKTQFIKRLKQLVNERGMAPHPEVLAADHAKLRLSGYLLL